MFIYGQIRFHLLINHGIYRELGLMHKFFPIFSSHAKALNLNLGYSVSL